MTKPEQALDPQTETPHPEGEVVFGTDAEHVCSTCKTKMKAGSDVFLKKEPVIDQLLVEGKISLKQGNKQTWQHHPECPSSEEVTDTIQ